MATYGSAPQFNAQSTPYAGSNPFPTTTAGLQGLWGNTLGQVNAGRPGAYDYLFKILDALGMSAGQEQQYNQYSTMAPYMTDASQWARYQQQQLSPYVADQAKYQSQMYGMQAPYMQQKYNWMGEQMTNPFINYNTIYGSQ